ncbi:unnamed protein product, partial [Rotaria socialis]
ALSCSLIH